MDIRIVTFPQRYFAFLFGALALEYKMSVSLLYNIYEKCRQNRKKVTILRFLDQKIFEPLRW